MTWQENAVPAYTIVGGRLLRGRGVSLFPEQVTERFSQGRREDRKRGSLI